MNEERFTGKAQGYSKFRPGYPNELFDYLYNNIGFNSNSFIADIGAGTGIFTKYLLERGSSVVAVEPNEDMRSILKHDLSNYEKLKKFSVINAPAEQISLESGSVDFVTVAQAFHWFNRQDFKRECARILKSGGKSKVVLVWNSRDLNGDYMKEYEALIDKYCSGRAMNDRGSNPEEYKDFFDGEIDYQTFRNDSSLDKGSFIGRCLSSSYAPREENEPEKYVGFVRELGELWEKYASNGLAITPQITRVFIGGV